MKSKWTDQSVDSLVAAFLQLGHAHPDLEGEGRVEEFDRHEREMRELGKALEAAGPGGQAALIGLMDHAHIPIRLRAAQASLDFARDRAIDVLIDITEMRASEFSMGAMMTLMFMGEFDMKTGPKRRPNPIPPEWEWKPKGPSR